ncbi:phage terminase small subunit P27 family [Tautonia plasticadhaerens]|uniref:Phage terminase, small subunit n=1 Tax=Tautonia plasticadhaerens TaxID=2527974 RepID=A0A518GZM7_9BACT|nr:phage terminase small subunit P27 family [Tautonia plasticadhaerens]QDV34030.1 Phage terminase, small subunit [Tautonia plasticadhaerens]
MRPRAMPTRGPKTKAKAAARRASKAPPRGTEPPGHLADDEHAADAWRHLTALLSEAGNLERTDPTIVEAYAINVSMLRTCHEAVARDGPITLNAANCPVPHPAAAMINAATMRLKSICYDLGLVPATSKYAATPTDATGPDRWGDLLGVVG